MESGSAEEGGEEPLDGMPFAEKDPRLAQLAISAAKSLHQVQGVQYDDSEAIDMYKDVKLSVVELKLPLGRKY